MPIGKIGTTAGKGADYSAGSQNIQHNGELVCDSDPSVVFYEDSRRNRLVCVFCFS